MSWFSDIAGRAEDFLTKVDQTAASALQKPLLPGGKPTSYSRSSAAAPRPSTSPGVRVVKHSTPMSLTGQFSPVPKKPSNKHSDEKLLEFLNSPEPSSAAPKRTPSQHRLMEELPPPPSKATAGEDSSVPKTKDEVADTKALPPEPAADQVDHTERRSETDETPSSRRSSLQQSDLQQSAASESAPEHVQPEGSADNGCTSLEEENRLLRKEVSCLNQEMVTALQRAKSSDLEKKHLQNRLDHWNSQVSSSDSAIRELQARERDLTAALDAKDAQLAVLRVRLQEADQELTAKRHLVDQLRHENQRLSSEQTDSSQVQSKAVDALREDLARAEEALRREQESHRATQTESMQHRLKMEGEVGSLSDSLTTAQRQLSEQKVHAKETANQVSSLRCSLELARQELVDYKQKAQRILQSKEKLIASLKDAANTSGSSLNLSDTDGSRLNISAAELEATTQECEQLRTELQRMQAHADTLSGELQEQGSTLRREVESLQEQQRALLEEVRQERHQRQEAELEGRQATEEIGFLREELRRTKDGLQQRVAERDAELEKLRKQITTKSMSTTSEAELEARLHALTESLIQKQTLVEALSTEKNSLSLQLERLERQLKETQSYNSKPHTSIVGFSQSEENARSRVPGMFAESPFDGTMTRKVKRAYGVIDSFSVRAGVFLRRYPLARTFILVYMGLLHFWVMIVLLTYEPEIHGPHSSVLSKHS